MRAKVETITKRKTELGHVIVVIQAEGLAGSMAIRTDPISPVEAISVSSRMWLSPTPATRERLDAYPSIPQTGVMLALLSKKPPVLRWSYRREPSPSPCN